MTNDNTHTPDGAGETTPPLSLVARALVAAATEAVHVPLTVLLVSPAGAEVAHSWWDADDGGQGEMAQRQTGRLTSSQQMRSVVMKSSLGSTRVTRLRASTPIGTRDAIVAKSGTLRDPQSKRT